MYMLTNKATSRNRVEPCHLRTGVKLTYSAKARKWVPMRDYPK